MGECSTCLPKTFLCFYPLKCGTTIVGIVGFCVMSIFTIYMIVQVCLMTSYQNAHRLVYAMIYSLFMALVHLWLIWGVRTGKPSVVLSWVVINIVWLIQSTTLLIILICIHSADVALVFWVTNFIFTIITIGLEIYALLIAYAYWLELKNSQEQVPVTN